MDKTEIALPVELFEPGVVLNVQVVLVNRTQGLQVAVEDALYLQQPASDLWPFTTTKARQGPLLTLLPTGKLLLAVT